MHVQKIPFRNTNAFSGFFLSYIEAETKLKSFYSRFPSTGAFKDQIKEKSNSFSKANRTELCKALRCQYEGINVGKAVDVNLHSLSKEKTFTVTTGHQLSIFTGPLYFVFKVVTVIKACRVLKKKYPSFHFVPVYWMASEDHDYDEIKSFRLNGKKYTWKTQQQGAVGRFTTTDFKSVLEEIPGDTRVFRDAYTKSATLAGAVRQYVNELFGDYGLVVVDGDDPDLKRQIQGVMRSDIFDHKPYSLVTKANNRLKTLGLNPQVNPREINFFYLDAQLRSRIEQNGDTFTVLDTPLRFSRDELDKKIQESPGNFSPNVILRPVYQELILPNLAYVGGPAELVYWLELKAVFDLFKLPFPILLPRNFGLVVDSPTARKIGRTGLPPESFFESKSDLFKRWVNRNSKNQLSLTSKAQSLAATMAAVQKSAEKIDRTLGPMTAAQAKKMQTMIRTIEQKMMRAEKRAHADGLRQVEAVKDALFPEGSLQERIDNFLNFYQTDPEFLRKLIECFDPFDFRFQVLTYHDKTGNSKKVS